MCILLKLYYAEFGVSTFFFYAKFDVSGSTPPPLVVEGLITHPVPSKSVVTALMLSAAFEIDLCYQHLCYQRHWK